MAHGTDGARNGTRRRRTDGAGDDRKLTPRQARVKTAIEEIFAATGRGPTRNQLSEALGYQRASSVESHLLALQRRGEIILGPKHRSIRIVDHDETPVLDAEEDTVEDAVLATEARTVDRMPGSLTRRLSTTPDYLLRVNESLEHGAIGRGDLAALQRTINIRDGSIVVTRNERGQIIFCQAWLSADHETKLTRIGSRAGERQPTLAHRTAWVRIEGVLTGVVQVRGTGRGAERTRATTPHARETQPPRAGEPTRQQRQVLEAAQLHLRRYAVPPSLAELSEALGGRDTGTIHRQIRSLAKRGLIAMKPGARGYWPTDMETVPLVDPGTGTKLARSAVVAQVPSVLAGQLDPRPDVFIAGTEDLSDGLGLKTTDLIAVEIRTEAKDGEIVIARIRGRRRLVCGELRGRGKRRVEVLAVSGEGKSTSIVTTATDNALLIQGVMIGSVRFRSL